MSSQGWPITATSRVALIDFASRVLPVSFRGGFMFDALGRIAYASAGGVAPDGVVAGFPFDVDGSLKINNGSGPIAGTPTTSGGFTFGSGITQSLQVSDTDAIASYNNGLPFTVDKRLCVTLAGTPVGAAFSDGFDEGFA